VLALWLVLAFLSGSVPFGLLIARARGIDIRAHGSGNIGAANVARNLGRLLGFIVLLLDLAKGALPLMLLRYAPARAFAADEWLYCSAGLCAILGHCFTPWLRFKGGKGVATTLGVFLALDPLAAFAACAVFLPVLAATRIVALGSLAAAVALPLAVVLLQRSPSELGLAVAVATLVIVLHRDNLARVRSGRENRL
jgi:glycerol-3-phosphate acyltransferase PlsY